jgi:hypothetical protein
MTLRACFVPFPASSDMAAFAFSGSRDSHPGSPKRPGAIVPFRPTTTRVGRPSSRHHVTSVTSPNVQTIAMPVPFSGSANSCATTGTGASNSGVYTVDPTSSRYRSSAGLVTSATHAGMSSGRDVSISTAPPPSRTNAIRWYRPSSSRSSISACATAVWKSTSQVVGASAVYACPRLTRRRNARCEARRATSPIVV